MLLPLATSTGTQILSAQSPVLPTCQAPHHPNPVRSFWVHSITFQHPYRHPGMQHQSLAARKESRFGITSSVCLLGPVVCAAEVDELRTSGTPNHTPHHFTLGETETRRKGDSSKVQSYSGSKAGCSPPPPLQPPQDTLYTVELSKHV